MGKVQRFCQVCMKERGTYTAINYEVPICKIEQAKKMLKLKFALDYLIECYCIMPTRAAQT